MNIYIIAFINFAASLCLALLIYMIVYYEPAKLRTHDMKSLIIAYEEGRLKRGDKVIINHELMAVWIGFADEFKTLAHVMLDETNIVKVSSSFITLPKSMNSK